MKRVERSLAVMAIALATACGGEVTVAERPSATDGGTDGGGGSAPPSCARCGSDDCGLCALEGGEVLYACWSSTPPPGTSYCVQTGSVYHDPSGGSYVCWRCSG